MRILRVIHSAAPAGGGPAEHLRQIVPAMQPLGVTTEIACADAPDAEYLRDLPCRVHALGPGDRLWGRSRALSQWLEENVAGFDAVVMHGLWLHPSLAVHRAIFSRRSAAERRPRFLVMPHGMLDPWFQRARPIKAVRNWLYWHLIESRVVRDADAVLFTSAEERKLARAAFGGRRWRAHVIPYGVAGPPAGIAPAPVPRPYWLYLGRLHPKKGVDLLLAAYGKVIAENAAAPDLIVAGPASDSATDRRLRQLAAPLGDRVTFPGMLAGVEKWRALAGCSALVLPSHQENFGIVVAEALACGRPVLLTDKVNIWRDVVADGAGFAATDDADGIHSLLARWLGLAPAARDAMAGAARPCFDRRFEIGQAAREIAALAAGASSGGGRG